MSTNTEKLTAYCVKCQEKREMQDPDPTFTSNGRPATRGNCPVCGTNTFRMGRTKAHEGLTPPPTTSTDPGTKNGRERSGKLVIVESPAKARTIGRFLSKEYSVKASIGHVRDLLKSRLSVDVENDFKPRYRVPNEKRDVVKELKKAVDRAEEIYLATDPDREGEAIAWHLLEAADIPSDRARRVVFHEITKPAINEAFANPRGIDMQLVDAQQARRILDRLVGYQISPLLWRNVRSRLSAGRVQSVALRMLVEREREIRDFDPDEYWSIEALFAELTSRGAEERPSFEAKLHKLDGEDPDLPDAKAAQAVVDALSSAEYAITEVRRRTRRRNPSPPFTTSTLQQDASRRLGFSARKTMRVAQQLYEGISAGSEGSVGLITYMRTDSVNVSQDALGQARAFIEKRFGDNFLPKRPRQYQTKAKGAQEAHEAIRPTGVNRTPQLIRKHLSRDQYRLYQLIWKRFVASQMMPAVYDVTSVDIVADTEGRIHAKADGSARIDEALRKRLAESPKYLFRASGSVLRFPGFLVLYQEGRDEDEEEESDVHLPDLFDGERLDLLELIPNQHFTQPPPRFSEATLVKGLEENGIGRPSTYAPIINTLQTRGYVERQGKRLTPTELGEIVNDLLVEHFPDVMDVGFTAQMEEDLDRIAGGEREWVEVLHDFYGPFSRRLESAKKNMQEVKIEEETGELCEKCGSPLIIKYGRYGKFIACSNFPDCRNTKPYLEKIGVTCPDCGGDIVERRTRRGRLFYGCSNYPDCEWSSWKRPASGVTPCPACGGLLAETNRRQGRASSATPKTLQCLDCEEQFTRDKVEATREVEPA